MTLTRQQLTQATQEFCNSFSNKEDVTSILSHFSKTYAISAFEHGEPALAPFLGRKFEGAEGVQQYFELIGSLLSYEEMQFSEFVVDTEGLKAAVKGRGRFTWKATGESWDETFAYVLDFDDDGKVVRYQIWADSGAAYLARTGQLDKTRGETR